MTRHVRFTLGLYRHSGRGLAPLITLALWFLFAIATNPPSLSSLSALFPAFVVVGPWIAISVGDVDDRSHREMAVAAAGSPARLHRARVLASFVLCAGSAVLSAAYITVLLSEDDVSRPQVFVVSVAVLIGASALGVAFGSWLCAPLVSNRVVSLVVGLALPLATLLLPPVQDSIRDLGAGALTPGFALASICIAVGALLVVGAAVTANRPIR